MGLRDVFSGLLGGGADASASGNGAAGQPGDEGESEADPGEADRPRDVTEYGPAEFRAEAEEFAAENAGLRPDFSFGSLSRVDGYAATMSEKIAAADEGDVDGSLGNARDRLSLWFGAYLGEVLVRRLDGEWTWTDGHVAVTVPAGSGAIDAAVLDVGVQAAQGNQVRLFDFAAGVREAVWRAEGPGDGDVPAATVLREAADEASEWFDECGLDYSLASLERLDEVVDETWAGVPMDDAEYGGDAQGDRAYTWFVRTVGAYFGEVLARAYDGEWVDDDGVAVEVPTGDDGTATVNALHVAEDCFHEPSKLAPTASIVESER